MLLENPLEPQEHEPRSQNDSEYFDVFSISPAPEAGGILGMMFGQI